MGRKKIPGLFRREGVWHIDKRIRGRRLCESTGQSNLERAEFYLARRIDEIRHAEIFGDRPDRSFRQAATKYLLENTHKRSIGDDAMHFRMLDPFIGDLPLRAVHRGSMQGFVDWRRKHGIKSNTINASLKSARRVLNLASSEWLDENGLTWLERAPKITMLKVTDARGPYPLSFEEQERLFAELPEHLARMALFKVALH